MKQALVIGGALAAMLSAAPLPAAADDSIKTGIGTGAVLIANASVNSAGEIDAGSLVDQDVYDRMGDKVGEIDSVMADPQGKVTAVVLDVSGWLESEKLVAVPWSDLKTDPSGKIVSSLTKDSARAAATYSYKDPDLRGKVMTESGERYSGNAAPTATTGGAAAGTTTTFGRPVMNADGSLNASKLIGVDVRSPEDKKVGDIDEVVLNHAGKAQGVVVDVGGFLGIATHPVLLSWQDMTITSDNGKIKAVVSLTKNELEQMPTYESSSR